MISNYVIYMRLNKNVDRMKDNSSDREYKMFLTTN